MSDNQTEVRVLVVDDDPVFRRILCTTLARIPGTVVAAQASTLAAAQTFLEGGDIDVVTLDVVMKGESGLDLLGWMRTQCPSVITALVTAGTVSEASHAADALLLGASTLVLKPSGAQAAQQLFDALSVVIRGARERLAMTSGFFSPALEAVTVVARPREVIAVGSSAGGPQVVQRFLADLPDSFAVPIMITQHMPALHMPYFAEILARATKRRVHLAQHGNVVEPQAVYLAGDGKHMLVGRRAGRLVVLQDEGPEEHYCRPAVDPLFRSVAQTCGAASIGVVMSGMGSDGALGAKALRSRGAPVVIQDKPSSIVWGMPGAVAALGAASEIVPAGGLAAAVVRWTHGWKGPGEETSK